MTEWWNSMPGFQQVMFVIACAATLFMIVQLILLAIGSGDSDASFDSDTSIGDTDSINDGGSGGSMFGLKILSVRSVVAFFAIGCWLTFALFYAIEYWSLLPGIAAGIAAAFLVAYFMMKIEKLQENGAVDSSNTVGKTAEVYLTVPPLRSGNGKVNVYVQERYAEFEAVTDSPEPIKTGAKVKVVQTVTEGTLLVEPFASSEGKTTEE